MLPRPATLALVEQEGFEVGAFAVGFAGEVGSVQFVAERFDAEACEEWVLKPGVLRAQQHETEGGAGRCRRCGLRFRG